jgi:hypothetical protein
MIRPAYSKTPSRCSGFTAGQVPYEGTYPYGRSVSPTHPGRTPGHTTP